ncbi:MAG: cyclic nucleotide-binding domain-containing protein [Salinisphaera sp.]|nr:cyclic nucleotide-binding domain-containing protein [Salinisphaera sp.]
MDPQGHQLADAQLLRRVEPASLALIEGAGEILPVPAGQRLINEGEVPERLIVLLAGRLEVFAPDPADRSHGRRLATLNPGASCGEYGFIDRRPASASVKAVEDSDIFAISTRTFGALIEQHPEMERIVYRNLLSILVDRLRASNVVIDMLRSAPQ